MPVFVRWVDEHHTVIHMEFTGRWTWEELVSARDTANRYLDLVDYSVNFIISAQHENWMPPNYHDRLLQVVQPVHTNAGLMVIVNSNTFFRQWFELFNEVSHRVKFRFRFVSSMDEAYLLLGLERPIAANPQ